MRSLLCLVPAALLALAHPARAQSGTTPVDATAAREDSYSYWALLLTPTAAFSPYLSPVMLGMGSGGGMTGLSVRYGHVRPFQGQSSDFVHDAFGVGLDVPLGRATSGGVTVGYMRNDPCVGCEGHLMLGGHVETRLLRGEPIEPRAPSFRAGLRGEVGYAPDVFDEASVFSAAVSAPVAVALPLGATSQVVPFVSPAAAYGRYTANDATAERVRFMLGGGVTLVDVVPGLSLGAGVQRPFYEHGRTEFGVGVSVRVR